MPAAELIETAEAVRPRSSGTSALCSVRKQNPLKGGVAGWFPARLAPGQATPPVLSDLDQAQGT